MHLAHHELERILEETIVVHSVDKLRLHEEEVHHVLDSV